jgi:phage terminase large subunit GpA-like protein
MSVMLANPARIAREVVGAALKPAPPLDYLAWAERNVVIDEGSFPGPYNRSLFCYFDEILRALSPEDPCRYVTLMGSAQIGKTTLANVFTLGSLTMGRGTFLYAHPTDE